MVGIVLLFSFLFGLFNRCTNDHQAFLEILLVSLLSVNYNIPFDLGNIISQNSNLGTYVGQPRMIFHDNTNRL